MSFYIRTERKSTDSISEELLRGFKLKMPELKLPRVDEPKSDVAKTTTTITTKRSRSKPKVFIF